MFEQEGNRLVYRYDAEQLWLEPWGSDSLRVRATKKHAMPTEDWALDEEPQKETPTIEIGEDKSTIVNGKIKATVTSRGKLTIHNAKGDLLLEEYARHRLDPADPKCSALNVEAREFKPLLGGDYQLTMRLESVSRNEKLYGMGQYQQPYLDLKGLDLELAQRNSQASVPFMLSSLGYGLLWNNPSVGRSFLGKNIMSFEASSTGKLDYWIVAGDSPSDITSAYAKATGYSPEMPEYGLGFWQSKLRYQTQEELLSIAHEYKKRDLPIDVLVVDFFHWPLQGDWKFDPTYWPDPDGMIKEIKDLGIEVMVSIWPTVDKRCENYPEMLEKGLLVRAERGIRTMMDFQGDTVHFDATHPKSREYVWNKAKQNYFDKGIRLFWLDEAEPEYSVYDFENYRYYAGPNAVSGNFYPREYAKAFYEGQVAAGQKQVVNLIRCAWAGSQKYGALVWSGDIASSWDSFRNQLAAGLNMGIAGINYWTTDIGGFHGGSPSDPEFQELLIRWFQWGTFLPVMRLHGDREPHEPQHGTTGGATCLSGAPNEVWSYGEEAYGICKKYLKLRESMREYTRSVLKEASQKGTPVIRPLFFDFPEDKAAWEIEDQYTYGSKYLVCPVQYPGQRTRKVYFPQGAKWKDAEGDAEYEGGKTAEVPAPLDTMPVFVRL